MKRKATWAGQFYPSSPGELTRIVDEQIEKAGTRKTRGELLGLVVPHAGYVYSGAVAGHAYRYLRESAGDFDTVVLVGNAHHALVSGVSIYAEGSFASPLGEVAVDAAFTRELLKQGEIDSSGHAHEREHGLEVQLPFLQRVLKDFKIVPVLLGPHLPLEMEKELIDALARGGGEKKALLVASSDMSHYPDYDTACEVDKKTLSAIGAMDLPALDRALDEGMGAGHRGLDTGLCGEGAVKLVLRAVLERGANEGIVLNYANSGDVSGDKSQVVGYGAVAFIKS